MNLLSDISVTSSLGLKQIILRAPLAIFSSGWLTVIAGIILLFIAISAISYYRIRGSKACREHINFKSIAIVMVSVILFGFSYCNFNENQNRVNLAKYDYVSKIQHYKSYYPVDKITWFDYF